MRMLASGRTDRGLSFLRLLCNNGPGGFERKGDSNDGRTSISGISCGFLSFSVLLVDVDGRSS